MPVLVLGDGNPAFSRSRAARAAVVAEENGMELMLLLGTRRQQGAMKSLLRDRPVQGNGFLAIAAEASSTTIGNARTAASAVGYLRSARLIVVTHQFHESPVPGINRVSRIFSAQFPESKIELELLPGSYPMHRLLHAAVGAEDPLVLAMRNGRARISEAALKLTGNAKTT
ncbi:MAG: YdcF family protein [Candidatus Micrarchaeota archaeon]|nr:YdcF family protein [Candidatus Micrarchaeota archaeon]